MRGLTGLALGATMVAAQPSADLIADITTKLKDIMAASKTEQKDNDAAFAKVQCECKEMIKEAETKIPEAEKVIAEGEALIESLRSDSGDKSMKVNSLQEKNAADRELIAERQKKRDDDFAIWEENDTNWSGSIAQLGDAIKVLAEGTAFLQESSSTQHKALIEAVSKVESAASHTAQLISLLQSEATAKNSGQVLGVLNKMLQMFEENKADALAAETKSKKMFLAWKKRTEDEISAAENLISELQGIMAENTSTITATQTAVKTAKAELAVMQKQLADFTKKLDEYTAEHAALSKESLELQEGLQKAITFMNSEEAKEKLAALTSSFVQTKSVSKKNHSFLAQSSPAMSLLSNAMALKKSGIKMGQQVGVWTTVLGSIADLKKAQEENVAQAKAKAKDCDGQMKVHFNVWKELIAEQLDLEAKKNELEMALGNAETSITTATDTISSKSAEIEQLEAETREIQTEYRNYADTAKAATPILEKTKEILAQPEGGVAEPTKAEFGAATQNKGTVAAVEAIDKVIEEMKKHVTSLKEEYEKTNADNAGLIDEADAAIKEAKKNLATATGDKGENAGNLALCVTNLDENANGQFKEELWWGETGTNEKWGGGYTCATYMGRADLREKGNRTGEWTDSPEQGTGPYYSDVQTASAEIVELGKVEDIITGLQSGLEG
jgi:chromosome segregation ATPase